MKFGYFFKKLKHKNTFQNDTDLKVFAHEKIKTDKTVFKKNEH